MNIFIEGPRWAGMWTEIIADTLRGLGHNVDFCYHNHKTLIDRAALAGQSLRPGSNRKHNWQQRQRQRLIAVMQDRQWDILLSIQGNINVQTADELRDRSPRLKIIYWWGDILTDKAQACIREAAGFADRLLVSYAGSYQALRTTYGDRMSYFPFGVSGTFHTPGPLSACARKRFSRPVAFVGTYYPERCALIRYLNQRLDTPVAVWGRGWRKCHGIAHHGALTLADTLKVYHCSRISLNLHHVDTPNGFNMKYYEIPVAGGLQLCDWQPLMETPDATQAAVACRSPDAFASEIHFYLENEQQRRQTLQANRQSVLATSQYKPRLAALLNQLTREENT